MTKEQFLSRVQAAGGLADPKEAERWSRAVLSALAQLAPDSQTRRQLIAQLPGFLKRPLLTETPRALLMGGEALIQHVAATLDIHAPTAERAVRSVYGVLRGAVSAGELADFEARLPPDAARLLESTGQPPTSE
ncbi:MAG TPA: DUF2267 domain-containing protein [Methylomirabilota bacterium]|nr:DUF2267 domain-containing protein [Methylomirabilota bacterium]